MGLFFFKGRFMVGLYKGPFFGGKNLRQSEKDSKNSYCLKLFYF